MKINLQSLQAKLASSQGIFVEVKASFPYPSVLDSNKKIHVL